MKNNNIYEDIDQNSWFNCIGEVKEDTRTSESSVSDFDKKVFDNQQIINKQAKLQIHKQYDKNHPYKRSRKDKFIQEEFITSNSIHQLKQYFFKQEQICLNQEKMNQQKKTRQTKQSQYSKKYRQRKKETYQTLFQQNKLLKQKISQLEFRLREKQLQINRYKYAPPQKQFSIQELNAQFMKNTNLIIEKVQKLPKQAQGTSFKENEYFFDSFIKSFNIHGFGGTKKKQYLSYYMNQILQGLLKDSQKYLMILFSHSKDNGQTLQGLPQYQPINQAFFYVVQQMNEDKFKRLQYFSKNLYTMYKEYQKLCSNMLMSFESILSYCDNIHKFMKQSYITQGKDLATKRLKLETWFEFHKHGKMMRNLRSQWLQLLKNQYEHEPEYEEAKQRKKKIYKKS